MLNHITLMGRLTRDPELRRTGSGIPVASFTLAVDRDYSGKDGGEKEVDFIDIVTWRNTAEFVFKYFTKGRMAVVSGRLQIRSWNDKDGNTRRSAEVVADNVYFGDSKKDGDTSSSYGQSYGQQSAFGGFCMPSNNHSPAYNGGQSYNYNSTTPVSDYAMYEDDDSDLPF